MDSVILNPNVFERILEDVKLFLTSETRYRDLGVPYKRSYLLHGKPGCGKTSFISALAGELNLNICVLTLSHKSLNDSWLNSVIRDAPQNAIILLEDIDAIFPSSRNKKLPKGSNDHLEDSVEMIADFGNNQLSFSGLLNAIDGIASQEGRLFFMTTNYLERLGIITTWKSGFHCRVSTGIILSSKAYVPQIFPR